MLCFDCGNAFLADNKKFTDPLNQIDTAIYAPTYTSASQLAVLLKTYGLRKLRHDIKGLEGYNNKLKTMYDPDLVDLRVRLFGKSLDKWCGILWES